MSRSKFNRITSNGALIFMSGNRRCGRSSRTSRARSGNMLFVAARAPLAGATIRSSSSISDQGESGASASWREGFQRLVSDVGMGRAGIVMGLEVSRLARNNADWHRLLEICALADTLILDEDGVYDPASFNDRLCSASRER